mgnify:CR=1 FL=1
MRFVTDLAMSGPSGVEEFGILTDGLFFGGFIWVVHTCLLICCLPCAPLASIRLWVAVVILLEGLSIAHRVNQDIGSMGTPANHRRRWEDFEVWNIAR